MGTRGTRIVKYGANICNFALLTRKTSRIHVKFYNFVLQSVE